MCYTGGQVDVCISCWVGVSVWGSGWLVEKRTGGCEGGGGYVSCVGVCVRRWVACVRCARARVCGWVSALFGTPACMGANASACARLCECAGARLGECVCGRVGNEWARAVGWVVGFVAVFLGGFVCGRMVGWVRGRVRGWVRGWVRAFVRGCALVGLVRVNGWVHALVRAHYDAWGCSWIDRCMPARASAISD